MADKRRNPLCRCGKEEETHKHVFEECELYASTRPTELNQKADRFTKCEACKASLIGEREAAGIHLLRKDNVWSFACT